MQIGKLSLISAAVMALAHPVLAATLDLGAIDQTVARIDGSDSDLAAGVAGAAELVSDGGLRNVFLSSDAIGLRLNAAPSESESFLGLYGVGLVSRAPVAMSAAEPSTIFAFDDNSGRRAAIVLDGTVSLPRGRIEAGNSDIVLAGRNSTISSVLLSPGASLYLDLVESDLWGSIGDGASRLKEATLATGEARIDQLEMNGGYVGLYGHREPGTVGNGAWLQVGRIAASSVPGDPAYPSGTIHVKGNAALAVGVKPQDMGSLLATAAVAQGASTATRASLIAGMKLQGLVSGVRIEVGTPQAGTDTDVHIGSDASLILLADQTDGERGTATLGHSPGASLVVVNWDGTDLVLPVQWDADSVHVWSDFARGEFAMVDGTPVIRRVWTYQTPGLQSSEIVREVETLGRDERGLYAALPGYSFVLDNLGSSAVGNDAVVSVMDGAMFLPLSGGILQETVKAQDLVLEREWSRPRAVSESGLDTWWFADVFGDTHRTPRQQRSSVGVWGTRTDIAGGRIGAERLFKNGWSGAVSVAGASVDTRSSGILERTTGRSTLGAVTLRADCDRGNFEWRFLAQYGQAQTSMKQVAARHRLETEPEMTVGALGIQARLREVGITGISPFAGVSLRYARSRNADITDTAVYKAVSGTGFTTQTDSQFWSSFTIGADWTKHFDIPFGTSPLRVEPFLSVRGTVNTGDRKWTGVTRLAHSQTTSSAVFNGVSRFAMRMQAGVQIARSGVTDRWKLSWRDGIVSNSVPYAWSLRADVGAGCGEHGERSRQFGLLWRADF